LSIGLPHRHPATHSTSSTWHSSRQAAHAASKERYEQGRLIGLALALILPLLALAHNHRQKLRRKITRGASSWHTSRHAGLALLAAHQHGQEFGWNPFEPAWHPALLTRILRWSLLRLGRSLVISWLFHLRWKRHVCLVSVYELPWFHEHSSTLCFDRHAHGPGLCEL
jgi:hypothetical protein